MSRMILIVIALIFAASTAEARTYHRHHASSHYKHHYASHHRSAHRSASHRKHYASRGGRPARWCGWYMRSLKGGGPEYNLARNWARRGTNAGGPKVGAVVVWSHHVGLITGKASNGKWLVKSGNDGGRVRERPRSVSGAIAFREV